MCRLTRLRLGTKLRPVIPTNLKPPTSIRRHRQRIPMLRRLHLKQHHLHLLLSPHKHLPLPRKSSTFRLRQARLMSGRQVIGPSGSAAVGSGWVATTLFGPTRTPFGSAHTGPIAATGMFGLAAIGAEPIVSTALRCRDPRVATAAGALLRVAPAPTHRAQIVKREPAGGPQRPASGQPGVG